MVRGARKRGGPGVRARCAYRVSGLFIDGKAASPPVVGDDIADVHHNNGISGIIKWVEGESSMK